MDDLVSLSHIIDEKTQGLELGNSTTDAIMWVP